MSQENVNLIYSTLFFVAGVPVTEEELQQVAELSKVLDIPDDFLDVPFRAECQRVLPFNDIEPKDVKQAYLYIKANVRL